MAWEWDDTNGRVYSCCVVHMYSQWAIISLQGLDRYVATDNQYQVLTAKLDPSTGTVSPAVNLHN